jgi:uncharacterized protein YkwD
MKKNILILTLIFILSACSSEEDELLNNEDETIDQTTLVSIINKYRQENGLNAISSSSSLTKVAIAHVEDLEQHFDINNADTCNLHSWSEYGSWTPCCYTPDHKQSECMWNKPSEITGGKFSKNGYEISAYNSGKISNEGALDQWTNSPSHKKVILNQDSWKNLKWKYIGAAKSKHYAVVWFGN